MKYGHTLNQGKYPYETDIFQENRQFSTNPEKNPHQIQANDFVYDYYHEKHGIAVSTTPNQAYCHVKYIDRNIDTVNLKYLKKTDVQKGIPALKQCPICGGYALIEYQCSPHFKYPSIYPHYRIFCSTCGLSTENLMSLHAVIQLWETRNPDLCTTYLQTEQVLLDSLQKLDPEDRTNFSVQTLEKLSEEQLCWLEKHIIPIESSIDFGRNTNLDQCLQSYLYHIKPDREDAVKKKYNIFDNDRIPDKTEYMTDPYRWQKGWNYSK